MAMLMWDGDIVRRKSTYICREKLSVERNEEK
jgi:hypothetical protein